MPRVLAEADIKEVWLCTRLYIVAYQHLHSLPLGLIQLCLAKLTQQIVLLKTLSHRLPSMFIKS